MSTLHPHALYTRGRSFWKYDCLISTTVYHWFTRNSGNLAGPWPPLGGRSSWTGEPDWWEEQIKQMMLANIDIIYVHLIERFEEQRHNLFKAYAKLRSAGYDCPKLAPFLDPFGIWPPNPIDVATPQGKDAFAAQYIRFFNHYFSANTDPHAGTYLARIEDRLVLGTWWVVFILNNLGHLTRTDVESRLARAFPARQNVFGAGIWMASTALIDPDLAFSDERMVMFSGLHYCVQSMHNGVRTYHMQAGYWDQNIRLPGLFMPRLGGRVYRNSWDYVIQSAASDVHRLYIESWNEYDEGSGIYAADPSGPYISDYNTAGNTDKWSMDDDPFEYIHTTRRGAARLNRRPDLHATILGSDASEAVIRSSSFRGRFWVRNEGNSLWSGREGFGFAIRCISPPENELTATVLIDDTANEIEVYRGVFRGRPVEFSIGFAAPARPGEYRFSAGMFRETSQDLQYFGQTIEFKLTVI